MVEVNGQRYQGSALNERDCYLQAIEGLRHASAALRGIAILRSDQRWLLPVRALDGVVERVTKLMTQRNTPLLILPPRR